MFNIERACRLYRIPIIDYVADSLYAYGREDEWLLVAAGTGLMMGVMDVESRFRYCIDTDGIRESFDYRFGQWLVMMERLVPKIVVAGWYSNPANAMPLISALSCVSSPERVTVYLGQTVPLDWLARFDAVASLADLFTTLRNVRPKHFDERFNLELTCS